MQCEVLRQLREEIDAVFDAQQKFKIKREVIQPDSTPLTSKWAKVTSLLASVDDSILEKTSAGRISQALRSYRSHIKDPTRLEFRDKETNLVLHRVMDEWRRIVNEEIGIEERVNRARRWQDQRVLNMILIAWRQQVIHDLISKTATNALKKKTFVSKLQVMWVRWNLALRQAIKRKNFYRKRQAKVCYEVFHSWTKMTTRCTKLRIYNEKSIRLLVGRYWKYFRAAIATARFVRLGIHSFTKQQIVKQKVVYFQRWIECLETQKRWQFAARWSERTSLCYAFDNWKNLIYDIKEMRCMLQSATRRQRRLKMRYMLHIWNLFTQNSRSQKQRLAVVLYALHRRRAFRILKMQTYCDRKKETKLHSWMTRRALWTWHLRSHRDRNLRLRVKFLKEKNEHLMLRATIWRMWRNNYHCSVVLRNLIAKQRVKRQRECWLAFNLLVMELKQRRVLIASLLNTREERRIRFAIDSWQNHIKISRKEKMTVALCAGFRKRKLFDKAFKNWKIAIYYALKKNSMNDTAVKHLSVKLVQHWAKWAFSSRRELGKRISLLREHSRQRQMRYSVAQWKEVVYNRQIQLRRKWFNMWKRMVDMQQRQSLLKELHYLLQLRWRWQHWKIFVSLCQELRLKAIQARKLHEKRLISDLFVMIWLCKTRRYFLGASKLAVLANKHVIVGVFTQWRQRRQRSKAKKIAYGFHRQQLQSQYFQLLFALTVGYRRKAVAYNRRQRLLQSLDGWTNHSATKKRRREAEIYFCRRTMRQAVHLMFSSAGRSIMHQKQRLEAEAWYEEVLLQHVLSKWSLVVHQRITSRSIRRRVEWNVVGGHVFRKWRENCVEKQKLLKAAAFYSTRLVARSWRAIIRVTKRRQLALVMWHYTMTCVRLQFGFDHWKHVVKIRRGQEAIAASLYRMQEQQIVERHFTAWKQLFTGCNMARRQLQRELLRWRRLCWHRWKVWRIFCRWQRFWQLKVLNAAFSLGLKRYALQQQIYREIARHTTRSLLHRSLTRWRLERWLLYSEQKLNNDAKRIVMTRWKTFVVACRQKRRWNHFRQQLHRAYAKTTKKNHQRSSSTFRDSRVLQAQLKKMRVLMTHVFHAWCLVTHSQRRNVIFNSRSMRLHSIRPVSSATRLALEFWAHCVVAKYFGAWKSGVTANKRITFSVRCVGG
ncbi:uncharacterized protein PHALS_04070 [Plasmopara halstedii]|uniref:Sfi1 spindle body n=1 Tax=Plasmopara halstedii TaxID=4781 RepID=A0A0P1A805_PLAHL|nr:uncharacterized protein PHALS_04070 [Plasmopara halstedii]CEG36813.1 hypothetical protein PHALS_04070 [Plasmopara halstedii]|eukprot:XP_024573182.1 hypothetical protein PHALS_04070 [Plasmopara halstedii]